MTTTLAPSRLLSVALIYADLGWPVFPCKPQGKTPITEHGLKDASTDTDQIREWWDRTPDANLAIATGVAFDVLDIDGDEGFKSLGAAIVEFCLPADESFSDGPTVTTGKGAHCYFAPTGFGNRARVLPGVDWRGKGGYVVAPPSVHPSGATYRFQFWSNHPVFGVRGPLPQASAWLISLLEPKTYDSIPRGRSVDPSNTNGYGRRALESECGRIALAPEGQRNDALNRGAFAMGQLVAGGALASSDAIDALEMAGNRAGLPDEEIFATIRSGFQKGYAQPRSLA